MSFNHSSSAANRSSIFETFSAVNLRADGADDDGIIMTSSAESRPVKAVARRSFEEEIPRGPGPGVDEYVEGGGDDVECIEEEFDAGALFMSCSPGRASSEGSSEGENLEHLLYDKADTDFFPESEHRKKKKKKLVENQADKKKGGHSSGDMKKSVSVKNENKKSSGSVSKKKSLSSSEKVQKSKELKEPKKPLSSYALFYRDTQSVIKSESPSLSFGEISKIVATMWDRLEPEQKETYNELAEESKKNYSIEMARYQEIVKHRGESSKSKEQQKKKKTIKKSLSSAVLEVMNSSDEEFINDDVDDDDEASDDSIASSEEDLPSDHGDGQQSDNRNVTNTLCIRRNCPNRAVQDPRWCREYCSAHCVVNHCRDVFTSWVAQRRDNNGIVVDT